MRLRLDTVASDGSVHSREWEVASISVGRGRACTIALPGLRVGEVHLHLRYARGGDCSVEAVAPYRFGLDDRSGLERATLAVGQTLAVGPHRLQRLAPEGSEDLRLALRTDAVGASTPGPLDLAAAGLGMRRPAWALVTALLLLTLALPLWMAQLPADATARQWLPTDALWNSGRISDAHQHLAGDCRSCHTDPFVPVRDAVCLDCHTGLGDHSDDPLLLQASGLETQSCNQCHKEHGGAHAVLPQHPGLCADCHARPHQARGTAALPAVRDFGRAHPGFRVQVIAAWQGGQPQWQRRPLAEEPADLSGLIFPHQRHLQPELEGPQGPETLACASCHRPGPGKVGFEPIGFEPHCQRCHAVEAETGAGRLPLPHGDPPAAKWMLEQVAAQALAALQADADAPGRRRAGLAAERGEALDEAAWIRSQLGPRLCGKCHEPPAPDAPSEAAVAPLHLAQSWWPQARFSHAPHQATACDSCHGAATSTAASELLLPDIATCRSCHAGVASAQGIRSACVDCHGFHTATPAPPGVAWQDQQGGVGHAETAERRTRP
jgi:predicted CXXCH cytochrome family protein